MITRFFTRDQQKLIREIFEGMIQPEWHGKFDKQLQDDAGGYGKQQNLAIFGRPGQGPFEFVLTGRHMTLRCDGNSAEHVAFGGPILYGHAASGFTEKPGHPGNVFWEQAVEANKVCGLAFYTDEDLGSDRVWHNWRLEGPALVWYFRGNPHVHVG